jgi:integrase
MAERITARLVRVAIEIRPERDRDFYDDLLTGFVLRVRRNRQGGKHSVGYYVRPRVHGQAQWYRIGNARVLRLDDARKAAREKLGKAATGQDPAAERREAREAWTIRKAAAEFEASDEFAGFSETTRKLYCALLRNHVVHCLWPTRLENVDLQAIQRLHTAITHDQRKNNRGRSMGGPTVAKQAARLVSKLLSFAVARKRLVRNHLHGVLKLPADRMRESVLTEAGQYAALFHAMDDLVAKGDLRPAARAFIIAAMGTGMRRSELHRLRWRQVDLAVGKIVLPETKGSRLSLANTLSEVVHLPPVVALALADLRRDFGGAEEDLVFKPNRGEKLSVNRAWRRVARKAGVSDDVVLHSLRHSIGTAGAASGMSAIEVMKLLRHRQVSTATRYVHLHEQHARRLSERALGHLLPLPAQPGDKAPASVLPLRKR